MWNNIKKMKKKIKKNRLLYNPITYDINVQFCQNEEISRIWVCF